MKFPIVEGPQIEGLTAKEQLNLIKEGLKEYIEPINNLIADLEKQIRSSGSNSERSVLREKFIIEKREFFTRSL